MVTSVNVTQLKSVLVKIKFKNESLISVINNS